MIENRLHFVRDTAFREDASKVRTGHGPENMATLRSFAITQLRAGGHTNIAAGLREMPLRPFERPLALLGLSRPAPTQDHQALQSPCSITAHLSPADSLSRSPREPAQPPLF
ncbi:hypothetical protein GCM10010094_52310 [Streptomyces flaveus]|uniref:Transposase n=1 Tax=Streptomyces flaveus TaxID=66370 RepID=A0A917R2M5_9ACTN|nr:hypothetical protein GCM10010094_52310 [Streptomyces flaveus]